MSDHAWWTPARRKLYGRPTVNGMTCQICGCDMCQCNRLVPVSDPPRAATIGEHVDAVMAAKDAEIERLRAELSGQRDGEAQEIVTLRQRLAEACADAAQLRKFLDDALKRAEQAERERDETVSALRTSRALSAIAQRQRDDLRALLREATSDECVVCGASLYPHMSIPPHCEDCVVEDDVACDHEARVHAFRARLDAALGDERR